MHEFKIDGESYGVLNEDADSWGYEVLDESKVRINQVPVKARFKYEYDFGDGWDFEIKRSSDMQ